MSQKENKTILENVKLKIAISNFEKEEKREMEKLKKNHMKYIAVASLVVVSMTGVAFAKDIQLFVRNLFGANASDGVQTAVDNGYVETVETEYQTAEGIEIRVDSMLMDDFNLDMNFHFKIGEQFDINEFEKIDFQDMKIIDENEKIVFNTVGLVEGKTEEELKEEYYRGGYSISATKINEQEFTATLSATGSPIAFSKSKKLVIDFTQINTWKYENEKKIEKIYEGDWHFEVDVPEEFYNRKTEIYQAKSCSDESIDISQIQATLSKTAFKIAIPEIKTDKVDYEALHQYDGESIYSMIALQKEYAETSNGKTFQTAQRSDGDGGYGLPEGENKIIDYHQTFNLTSFDATDEITVHIFTNKGEEIVIVLERM